MELNIARERDRDRDRETLAVNVDFLCFKTLIIITQVKFGNSWTWDLEVNHDAAQTLFCEVPGATGSYGMATPLGKSCSVPGYSRSHQSHPWLLRNSCMSLLTL